MRDAKDRFFRDDPRRLVMVVVRTLAGRVREPSGLGPLWDEVEAVAVPAVRARRPKAVGGV